MCDSVKMTTKEVIVDLNYDILTLKDEIRNFKESAAYYANKARANRDAIKAKRAEIRALRPARKPRKAKGFPVTEYFEPSPALQTVSVASVTADFERYSNGFNVYD